MWSCVENKCEGMIGLRELPGDVFRFDQERYTVVGQRTDRRFRLGDELRVVIKAVDMDRRTVELGLEGETMRTTSGKFERRAPKGAPNKKGFRQAPKASNKGKKKGKR
jgi:DNA-directed RNA polymerase subunit E'/Rpb7